MAVTDSTGAFSRAAFPNLPAVAPVSVSLEAEILADADTGQHELVVSTDGYPETRSPQELRAEIAAAEARLAGLRALADQYEAYLAGARREAGLLGAACGEKSRVRLTAPCTLPDGHSSEHRDDIGQVWSS
ncbi:hypothetical protein ACWF62_17715 [Rhodococcus sp. NPDC054953]